MFNFLPHYRTLPRALAILGMVLSASAAVAGESAHSKLDRFHAGLTERYADVVHISTHELAGMTPEEVVLFDVRKQSEYDVSRIDGAVRVAPSVSASAFLDDHAEAIRGKSVIFYCSVGERSSRLAERVMSRNPDTTAIYNLAGGIFKWHNEYKDVIAAQGSTTAIHPFNRKWGRLLERQDAIRTSPQPES